MGKRLGLIEWLTIATLVVAIIALLIGNVWDRIFPGNNERSPAQSEPPTIFDDVSGNYQAPINVSAARPTISNVTLPAAPTSTPTSSPTPASEPSGAKSDDDEASESTAPNGVVMTSKPIGIFDRICSRGSMTVSFTSLPAKFRFEDMDGAHAIIVEDCNPARRSFTAYDPQHPSHKTTGVANDYSLSFGFGASNGSYVATCRVGGERIVSTVFKAQVVCKMSYDSMQVTGEVEI
jgi:hypothetical protein